MYKVTIPTSFIKKSTSVLVNSNKLKSTINIISTGIIIKSQDLEYILNTFDRLNLKVSYKKVA